LAARGLRFRPHFWLSDEWFTPSGGIGVALPFYLAHPRLRRLERHQMNDVEGGTRADCLRILRHETGHAIQHAYRLHRRRRWQRTFGISSTPYPRRYRPDPRSRAFVHHLGNWYAQSHPDEDFAETFAVWLGPGAGWRRRYRGWPALAKLEYVEALMSEIGPTAPPVRRRVRQDPLSTLTLTLAEHYHERRRHYGVDEHRPGDAGLRRLFGTPGRHAPRTATAFLRRHRSAIRERVRVTGPEEAYAFDGVFADLGNRSRAMRLRTRASDRLLIEGCARFIRRRVRRVFTNPRAEQWIPV
jgi:hypothetical protein